MKLGGGHLSLELLGGNKGLKELVGRQEHLELEENVIDAYDLLGMERDVVHKGGHRLVDRWTAAVHAPLNPAVHVPSAVLQRHESTAGFAQSPGDQQLLAQSAAVLGHNYPNSEWYRDSYTLLTGVGLAPAENRSSWISQAIANVNPF